MKHGNIELLHMDCMEYMKGVPDKHFDLAIVDPEYGIKINMNMGRKADEENLKDEDKYIVSRFVQSGLGRRQLFALATELGRYLSDIKQRHDKFMDLMQRLHE